MNWNELKEKLILKQKKGVKTISILSLLNFIAKKEEEHIKKIKEGMKRAKNKWKKVWRPSHFRGNSID